MAAHGNLVLGRKDGQKVVIRHAGEFLTITYTKEGLIFSGPRSFDICRDAYREPNRQEPKHVHQDQPREECPVCRLLREADITNIYTQPDSADGTERPTP